MKTTMARVLLMLMVAALTACIGYVPSSDTADSSSTEPSVSLAQSEEPAIELIQPPFDSTVEYGEPDALLDNVGPLRAYIRFPQAGGLTDEAIKNWARAAYQSARDEVDGLLKTDSSAEGEININFDSYLVNGRYAGIVEEGTFAHSHSAHPTDVIQTFNVDTSRNVFLANHDIIDPSTHEKVLSLLRDKILEEHPGTAGFFSGLNESWLSHIAISRDGVLVILERGIFLPAYFGRIDIMLPYADLGHALSLGGEPSPGPVSPIPEPALPSGPFQGGEADPESPMVALTFDDGPSKHTERILDLLEQYGGRATFCVIGNLLESRKNTVTRAFSMGCEIIGHSWDHRDFTKLSKQRIEAEILDTNSAIEAITGVAPSIYRPPYGAANGVVKSVSGDLGFVIVNWSVDTKDWKTKSADSIYRAVMRDLADKSIILCHDLYGQTTDAMERVIPELLSRGYQLVTVSELLYCAHDTLEAGKIYYNGN